MKVAFARLLLIAILCCLIYHNRAKLLKVIICIEGIRWLMRSFNVSMVASGRDFMKDLMIKVNDH